MAGTAERVLALKLVADVSGIRKQMTGVTTDMTRTGRAWKSQMSGMASAAASWGKAFAGSVAISGVEALGDHIGDAIRGFVSGKRVADQLGVAWRNLGLDSAKLSSVLDQVTGSTLRLGTSDDEAVQVFTQSLERTHDYRDSLKRLSIAQDLSASRNISLQAAMKLVDGVAKGTTRQVDQFGIKSKTSAGRLRELRTQLKHAAKHKADLDPLGVTMNAIDEALESMVGIFATGDLQGGLDGMAASGAAIQQAWQPIFDKLDTATGGALGTTMADLGKNAGDLAATMGSVLGPTLASAQALLQALQPPLQMVQGAFQAVANALSPSMEGALGFVLGETNTAMRVLANLLNGDFSGAITAAETGLKGMADAVSAAFEKTVGAIMGLISKVVDAWNSLNLRIPAGSFQFTPAQHIPNPLGGYFDIPAVGISWPAFNFTPHMGAWKSGGLSPTERDERGRRSTPAPVGKGAPTPPGHASGGVARGMSWVGERGPELVNFGSPSRVIPHRESMALAGGGGNHYSITLNVPPTADQVSIGRQVVLAIREYERRAGKGWRT